MATVSISGGDHSITLYGNSSVYAGNGNDTITILGNGVVEAGKGRDEISVLSQGHITVGGGHDTVNLLGSGTITEFGKGGHDTINLGSGNDTIFEAGHATVHGLFGSATIDGGSIAFINAGQTHEESVVSGSATLLGGAFTNEFVGGSGKNLMIGSMGFDTMTGGSGKNIFEFDGGGHHVITNFVSGQDKLYVEGHSLAYLESHKDITSTNGITTITLDGGATKIVIHGTVNSTDFIGKKP